MPRVTGLSADFWLGLQQDWDLWHALRSDEAAEIAHLKPLARADRPAGRPRQKPDPLEGGRAYDSA